MNQTPDLIDHFEYNGRVEVEWFEVTDKENLPDLPWQQVYAIGNLNGEVPIVVYDNGALNLPGGTFEQDETVEQALSREIVEELNCRVLNWEPLGYQRIWRVGNPDATTYQLRVYADLEKIGDFVSDPGGGVVGYRTVALDALSKHINYGAVGDRLIGMVTTHFH